MYLYLDIEKDNGRRSCPAAHGDLVSAPSPLAAPQGPTVAAPPPAAPPAVQAGDCGEVTNTRADCGLKEIGHCIIHVVIWVFTIVIIQRGCIFVPCRCRARRKLPNGCSLFYSGARCRAERHPLKTQGISTEPDRGICPKQFSLSITLGVNIPSPIKSLSDVILISMCYCAKLQVAMSPRPSHTRARPQAPASWRELPPRILGRQRLFFPPPRSTFLPTKLYISTNFCILVHH